LTPISYRPFQYTGNRLAQCDDTEFEPTAAKAVFLPFALLIGLGMILLIALLVLFLNHIVLVPVHRMDSHIQKVKAGDYMISESEITSDEIGRLTQGFFDMANAVKVHTTELAERVDARTADLKCTTQALQQAKEVAEAANLAKTRFLSAASHDLRQPLQALRMFNEALACYPQDQQQTKLFDNVRKCQRIIQSMLDSLLDISKLDAGMVEPRIETVAVADLFERVQSACTSLADAKDMALFTHCCRDACIQTDLVMFERILANLLGNAIHHAGCDTILLTCRRRGDGWRMEVRDNGRGIAGEDQVLIFEEFHQLRNAERNREKGLGLGLAIVKRLCALLDHDLALRSETGRGATFAITAEATPCPATSKVMKGKDMEQPTIHFQRGLVVDDDALMRESLCAGMHAHGYTIRTAVNRSQAEQLLSRECPDFIICDYRLPEDDGIELIQHLWRCAGHSVPAVLLTGDTAGRVLQAAMQADIPVMYKPVDIAALFAMLRANHQGRTLPFDS